MVPDSVPPAPADAGAPPAAASGGCPMILPAAGPSAAPPDGCHRLVHRALSPQSLLVLDPAAVLPRVRICNWQTGARRAADSGPAGGPAGGPATSGASRLGDLIEDAACLILSCLCAKVAPWS